MADMLRGRFRLMVVLLVCFCALSLGLRLLFMAWSWNSLSHGTGAFLAIAGLGFFYDVVTGLGFCLPLLPLLVFLPDGPFRSRPVRLLLHLLLVGILWLLFFDALSEVAFFDEFGARLNFLAVDYLVYTDEILGTVRATQPLDAVLAGFLALAAVLVYGLRTHLAPSFTAITTLPRRLRVGGALAAVTIAALGLSTQGTTDVLANRYDREAAKNGLYSLFTAFYNNGLDYDEYYRTMPEAAAVARLRAMLGTPADPASRDTERSVRAPGLPVRHNVVLVMVESLSAEFLGAFGDTHGLTPNLDRLAGESLFFRRCLATGTRTVRGMEALTLSLPPTPGRSVVKRPDNADRFSLGFLFRDLGYDTRFIYAGYGYFDNMNAFCAANGFDTVDRSDLSADEVSFANIWGVCDDDLYRRVLVECDRSHRAGHPFFNYVLTTSNHRPYTYPQVIDLPSGTGGRNGAVKYTDHAIGSFLAAARTRPWFDDTVFVIVADHCANCAGRIDVQPDRYHIPLMVYAPRIVEPRTVDDLCSQVDVAPTLLGLLNITYKSRFFGRDLLAPSAKSRPFAFLGNYQTLGLMEGDRFTLLKVKGATTSYHVGGHLEAEAQPDDPGLVDDAVAVYQTASHLFAGGGYARIPDAIQGRVTMDLD